MDDLLCDESLDSLMGQRDSKQQDCLAPAAKVKPKAKCKVSKPLSAKAKPNAKCKVSVVKKTVAKRGRYVELMEFGNIGSGEVLFVPGSADGKGLGAKQDVLQKAPGVIF